MMTTKEIGGNRFYLRIGNILTNWGKKWMKKGSKTILSNPTCKLIGPFALKLDFTVNNTEKYQLITQGDYKSLYKNFGTDETPIGNDEMFMIITMNKHKWFLKT